MVSYKRIGFGAVSILGLVAAAVTGKVAAVDGSNNTPQILTVSLPNGWTNHPYTATIRSRDVDLGDRLVMISTSLPEGMALTNCQQTVLSNSERLNCDLTGMPTTPGTYTFKIGVVDSQGNTGTRLFTINLSEAP